MSIVIEAWTSVKCINPELQRVDQAGKVMEQVTDKAKTATVKWDADGAEETVKLTDITVLS